MQCCAQYEQKQKGVPEWRWPTVRCTNPGKFTLFNSTGQSVACLCGVHKDKTPIHWYEVEPRALPVELLPEYIRLTEQFIDTCEDWICSWEDRLEAAQDALAVANARQKGGA